MELDNWEKRIQEIQQKKEATPSLETRDQLISLLEEDAERGKRTKKIWWYAAAVLIFLVTAVSLLKMKYTIATTDATVVETPKKEVMKDSIKPLIEESLLEEGVTTIVLDTPKKELKETIPLVIDYPEQDIIPEHEITEEAILTPALIAADEKEIAVVVDTLYVVKTSIPKKHQYVKAADLLAWVDGQKSKDSLLNFEDQSTIYVSSDSLLFDSEKELFRDQNGNVFQRIGKKLKKLNTRVANRNYK